MKKLALVVVLAIGLITNIGTGGGDDVVVVAPESTVPTVLDARMEKKVDGEYHTVTYLEFGWSIRFTFEIKDIDMDTVAIRVVDYDDRTGNRLSTNTITIPEMKGPAMVYWTLEDFVVTAMPGEYVMIITALDASGHESMPFYLYYTVGG